MEQLQAFLDVNLQEILTAAVGVILVAVLLYFGKKKRDSSSVNRRLPPGPRPWPVIGNLLQLGTLPHQDLARLAKKYGPLMMLRLGSVPTLIVSSPKYAEAILKTHDKVFASRPRLTQAKIMAYDAQNVGFSPYGPYWRYLRKVFTLELVTAKRLAEFQSLRREESLSLLFSILDECKEGKPVDVDFKLSQMARNNITRMVINRSFFGPNSGGSNLAEAVKYGDNIKEVFRLYGAFLLGDYIPFLDRFDLQGHKKAMHIARKKNDVIYQRIIDEHREELSKVQNTIPVAKDLVDVLLLRSVEEDQEPFTDDQLKAILIDVILGATDTSSTTIMWALTELLQNPHIMKKLQEEFDREVGRERLVEESDIPRFKYLDAVIKETFRLHPTNPLMMPHESAEECEVGGYYIPAKCGVFINNYAIGRDPDVWERPLEFDPNRFLNRRIDFIGTNFELLPFGAGRRSCPGWNLGLLVVQYMLALLLHSCNWSLPEGQTPEKQDLSEAPALTLARAVPLKAVATPRLPLDVIYAEKGKLFC